MARRGRGGGRAGARSAAIRTPTPQAEQSESEMQDAASEQATPQAEETELQEEETVDDADEDDTTTPAHFSDQTSRRGTPARGRSTVPLKRKAGRPAKPRPQEWEGSDDEKSKGASSDVGTPKRRGGGWRGRGFGGGRWAKKGGPSHMSQVPLDKEGNMATVRDDEIELPEDAEGEEKVDKLGHLQGGREYRVRVFTIAGKGERLYMLSTEPARCIGFRDSYLFFQKHPQLYKIILTEEAKRDLIERSLIPHSYKGRAIGVVTARSVYREFGAKIIIGGKKVIDDYQAAAARTNGDVEGEIAVPEDPLPSAGQEYDRNRYVAWHGASSVYHSGAPTVPMSNVRATDGKKRKPNITSENWMYEHAQSASLFNSKLAALRRETLNGVYDIHTNQMHYPKDMQPTHAKWERLPPPENASANLQVSDNKWGPHIYDLAGSSSPTEPTAPASKPTEPGPTSSQPTKPDESLFPPVDPVTYRNLLTVDHYSINAPSSHVGTPGPDGSGDNQNDEYDIDRKTLLDVPDDIIALLPNECLLPFFRAREQQRKWKTSFGNEESDGIRTRPHITYAGLI